MARISQLRKCFSILLLSLGLVALNVRAEGLHDNFDAVLKSHVKDGVVNYPAIATDAKFKRYLEQLAQAPAPNSKSEKLVLWINAYNAFSIKGILDGRSPSSFFGRQSFFKHTNYTLSGTELTLDTLEHKMIRPLGDARIHFSVVCASLSCPKLRAEAYSEAKLETQLEENTRAFVNDPSRNRFAKADKIAQLSEIFKWFQEDFAKSAGSVQRFVAKYVNDPEAASGLSQDGYRLKYLDYDWSLNGNPMGGR